MCLYGAVAVDAVNLIRNGIFDCPIEAWNKAVEKEKVSIKEKTCPKNAFLGLCEAGLVLGVKKGLDFGLKNNPNKKHALLAYKLLCKNSNTTKDEFEAQLPIKNDNGHFSVVNKLFKANFLVV
jgi:Family of unknown function (DUF6979)